MERLHQLARANLDALLSNSYPGRGLVLGLNAAGDAAIQVYWIMGRSPNSRNRVFVADDDGSLRTEAADPSTMKDPSLVIYRAMAEDDRDFVVSNGHQTDTIMDAIISWFGLNEALLEWKYEPDEPNFTPRISGIVSVKQGTPSGIYAAISILRKSPFGDHCDRASYEYEALPAGLGYCVTTYMGDGDPLPSFKDEPYLLPIDGWHVDEITQTFWDALNRDNRVSLAVKMIDLENGQSQLHVINKYEQVPA